MYLTLIVFSLYFSYIDFIEHKIRNKSLLISFLCFLVISLIQGDALHPTSALVTIALSPILLRFRVGAGDIKLFAVFATFFLPSSLDVALDCIYVFSAIATLFTITTAVLQRSLQSNIALAPAICGAYIWCAS
ncbi:MAG: hypothetical protein F2819_00005 [Actinobacteria bacterium]|nr:hypothetical protein [Actinomycetota bacterium]